MKAEQSGYTLGALFSKLFRAPYIPPQPYAPGWQPNAPGNSSTPGWVGGMVMNPVPWPTAVPTLNAMGSYYGTPRARPIAVANDQVAPLFVNNMFIGGFVGKSQG